MEESFRTVSVFTGGAVGSLFGPFGTAAGGMIGGVVADLTTSLINDDERGYIEDGSEVVDHISRGEIPLKATGKMLLSGVVDTAGGFTGAGIRTARNVGAATSIGYSTGRNVYNRR